jgi:Ser/Thr protein kinase RdoA (MazF antagonist)
VLQRINHQIFKDVELLQRNIDLVTSHIRQKLTEAGETDIDRKVLTFLPAGGGKSYHFDGENYWRVSLLIPQSRTIEAITPASSYEAGKAFGRFQTLLSDLPDGALGETIPDFHNMPFRLRQFADARAADPLRRLAEVQDLAPEIDARAAAMCLQEDLYRKGQLKKRINHCDTKVNNILFDENDKVLCVIDLDTVMPGFVLSDIGDFIRTACNTAAEDEPDLDRIHVDLPLFEAYARGYMETAIAFLTPLEISLLPYGGRLLTYMQTVRFLTDYLNGDTYYKIHFPQHNLQRARAQFRLLQELEALAPRMDGFMGEWVEG